MTSRTGTDVRLSWIMVSHQSAADLELFLPTLTPVLEAWRLRGVSCELIIVDNMSTDRSVDVVKRLAPDAVLIENSENIGYGSAINMAVRRSRGEWLAIGNADLMVPEGGLDSLPEVLAGMPNDVALAGPTLLDISGNHVLSAGFFPTLATLVKGLVRDCRNRKYLSFRRHVAGPVDWVTGACLFVRRSHLEQVGGFDQEYFLYYEDVDLALRMSHVGKRCVYTPAVHMMHRSPHHVRPPQERIEAIVRASRNSYFNKHRPSWERACLALLCMLEPVVRRSPGTPGTLVTSTASTQRTDHEPLAAGLNGHDRSKSDRARNVPVASRVNGHAVVSVADAEVGGRSARRVEVLSAEMAGDASEQ